MVRVALFRLYHFGEPLEVGLVATVEYPIHVAKGGPPSICDVEERIQAARRLADWLFSQSRRYGEFLRYVTKRALSNTHEHLTEGSLGVEYVFLNSFWAVSHYMPDTSFSERPLASCGGLRLSY